MAKTKYYIPEKEKPHFNNEKGWIEKIEFQIKPLFEVGVNNSRPHFVLEVYTFREFLHFKYVIDYDLKVKNREVLITIKGLNAENETFPESGKAYTRIVFEDYLMGEYTFKIKRSSGEENIFKFHIDSIQNKITLKKELPDSKSNRKFIEVIE